MLFQNAYNSKSFSSVVTFSMIFATFMNFSDVRIQMHKKICHMYISSFFHHHYLLPIYSNLLSLKHYMSNVPLFSLALTSNSSSSYCFGLANYPRISWPIVLKLFKCKTKLKMPLLLRMTLVALHTFEKVDVS